MGKLVRQDDGTFVGKKGATVSVGVQSSSAASTVRIFYAGEQDGEAPFEFKIKAGKNKLLLAALGVENLQKMLVVEFDGDNEFPLKTFFWSNTHFHTTLDVVGV